MIYRYSSRRSPLKDFLATRLQGARRYDRIVGFFSSSLLEVVGEALERMTPEGGEASFEWSATPALTLWTFRLPGWPSGGCTANEEQAHVGTLQRGNN